MPESSRHPQLPEVLACWFARRGWRLRAHQAEMIDAAQNGAHALLVAATGAGKTLAGFLPSLAELIAQPEFDGLHTLYVSPLKALAVDIQRNLLGPIAEMGLDIRVETRTGDTPSDRRARQRARPPQILLTTPESLSLLLSYPDADRLFGSLRTLVIDEIHAFAPTKRGDLLSLAAARLEKLAPGYRRVALSATVADAGLYAHWLAPANASAAVRIIEGEKGAAPDITILIPEGRVPWSGHSGRYATRQVYEQIKSHRLTLVFCNTRGLAELIFQDLWDLNDDNLPIGIHHGSLAVEVRRKVEAAMGSGKLRALVATASLDLGVDWGDVDLVIQMGAPKGSSRLIQRIGRANHRLDEASQALIIPGNRFEYLEARAALDAVEKEELDPDLFRPGALDVLAQHLVACACSAPFDEAVMFNEVRSAAPYRDLPRTLFDQVLEVVSSGGYSLRVYERFRRLRRGPDGLWHVTHPRFAIQHRMNAGVIVDAPLVTVRFKNGRKLGTLEDGFASTLSPGDTFAFAGLTLEVERRDAVELIVRMTARSARIPTYGGARLALTTNLARRVRHFIHDSNEWLRFPDDVREWLEVQRRRSVLPEPEQLLVETFPHEGRHYMVAYPFEGWNAHQSLGMLLTRRMESAGLAPLGFIASDYALCAYSVKPVTDPRALFSPDILQDEFVEWVQSSHLLKRAFREVAVIGGLIERQYPALRKSGRQVTFSTDLIYDVLRRYEPDHLLLRAAWADARSRLTDVGRLAALLDRSQGTIVHKALDRVSPMAVPVLVIIGRENVAQTATEDMLLSEAEALAAEAMRPD
jgi:ATP-dependent Lhr-like helicase